MSFDSNEETVGKAGILALVILRVFIGWHFLYEGLYKLGLETWTSKPVLTQTKWIMSDFYRWMADSPALLGKVDAMNMYGLTILGFALILGLFTRYAAILGAVLLLSFYLLNPPLPGLYYTTPTEGHYLVINKTLIEMTALIVLAFIPTGKYFGLDRFLHVVFKKK